MLVYNFCLIKHVLRLYLYKTWFGIQSTPLIATLVPMPLSFIEGFYYMVKVV